MFVPVGLMELRMLEGPNMIGADPPEVGVGRGCTSEDAVFGRPAETEPDGGIIV